MEHDDRYHYNVMRRAIDLIDASPDPLSLDDMAAQMAMSPAHFQRIFSRWVGVGLCHVVEHEAYFSLTWMSDQLAVAALLPVRSGQRFE